MTIISEGELNRQMGRSIDPNQVPERSGGTRGHMQENIREGTDALMEERGAGKYGSDVHDANQVGGDRFYGSSTIISLNEAPPLQDRADPDVVVVPPPPAAPPAPKPPPFMFARLPKAPAAPAPAPAPVAPIAPPPPVSVVALLGRMKPKGQP